MKKSRCEEYNVDFLLSSGLQGTDGDVMLDRLMEEYYDYKANYSKNIEFDPSTISPFSKYYNINICIIFLFSANTIKYAPLQLVQIYYDTATFDEIEKDVKVTMEAQLGLIGGTMGLLTGR